MGEMTGLVKGPPSWGTPWFLPTVGAGGMKMPYVPTVKTLLFSPLSF